MGHDRFPHKNSRAISATCDVKSKCFFLPYLSLHRWMLNDHIPVYANDIVLGNGTHISFRDFPFCQDVREVDQKGFSGFFEKVSLLSVYFPITFGRNASNEMFCRVKPNRTEYDILFTTWKKHGQLEFVLSGIPKRFSPVIGGEFSTKLFTKFNFVIYHKGNSILDWELGLDSPEKVKPGRAMTLYTSITWKELDGKHGKPVSCASLFLFLNTLVLGGVFVFLLYRFNHRQISLPRLFYVITLPRLSAILIGIGTSLYASLLLFSLMNTLFSVSYPKCAELLVICGILSGFVFGYEAASKGRLFGNNMYLGVSITAVAVCCCVSTLFAVNLTEAEWRKFPVKKAVIVYSCLISYVILGCIGVFFATERTKKGANMRDQHSGAFITRKPLIRGSLISCLFIFMVIFNDVNKIVKASFITDTYTGWITLILSITVSSMILAYNNASAIIAQRKHQIYQFPSVIIDSLLIFAVIYLGAAVCTYHHSGSCSVTRVVGIACGVLAVAISGTGTAVLLFMLTWKNE